MLSCIYNKFLPNNKKKKKKKSDNIFWKTFYPLDRNYSGNSNTILTSIYDMYQKNGPSEIYKKFQDTA